MPSVKPLAPLVYYIDRIRAEGAYPLWDSRFMLGLPLAGDPHILWLYPLNFLLLGLPTVFALNLFLMLHVFIAGFGMFALLRRGFQTSTAAALIGALAFMFMPKFMAQTMGGVLAFGLAWVPLVWLGVRLAAKEGNRFAGALGGAALAMLTPIHIQITYYAAATSVAYFLWLLTSDGLAKLRAGQPALARPVWHRLTAFGAFLASFGLLAAPIWLPLLEILPYTSRLHFTLLEASFYQLPAPLLATLLAPTQFQFPEWMTFLGVVPVVLAFTAWLGPRRGETTFFVTLTLFALVYALGTQTPLFGLVFNTVPGASLLRVPTRLWAFGGAAVAVIAGLGVDALPAPQIIRFVTRFARGFRLFGVAYFGGLSVTLVAVSFIARQFQGQILVLILVAACLVGLVWGFWRGKLSRKALQLGLCLAIMADLMPLAQTFFTLEDPQKSFLQSSPALDYIAAQPGLFRTYSTHKELSYAAAAAHNLETLDGALSFQISHGVEIIKAATGCELQGFATGVPPCLTGEIDKDAYLRSQPNASLLGLLNVKFVVSSFSLTDPGLTQVSEADGVRVYANQKWLPRAFVVSKVEQAPDQGAALADLRQSDPSTVAIVVEPVVQAVDNGGTTSLQPAKITARRSGYYRLEATGPGWLVLSETWLPGWQARRDGISVQLYRTDYALLGVYVPTGPHTIELDYLPIGWRMGWPSLVAGLAGLTLWAVARLVLPQPRRK